MSRQSRKNRNFLPHVEELESRDVPSTTSSFSATLPDGVTVSGQFSTPTDINPSQEFQSLPLGGLIGKLNGTIVGITGTPTAEYAYGDLLGVTATVTNLSLTVQVDDGIASDGGADAQVDYVAGSITAMAGSGSGLGGGGGGGSLGGGSYTSGSGSISGMVWENANASGMMASGESGNAGVTVELLTTSGSVLQTTETDSDGNYTFGDLSNNQYLVSVDTTEALSPLGLGTASATGSVFDPGSGLTSVTIANGQAITGIDAGLYTPVSVEGTIFSDTAASGYFQSPDGVINGDTITLENASGTALAITTSGSDGSYEFAGLAPGTYQVSVGLPLGSQFTSEGASGNPSVDSDVNSSGLSSTVTLADGAAAATINAGLVQESGTGSISGIIDSSATGTETGASGLTVQLSDPATGTILQTTTTDSNGDYSFGNLVAGNYSVTVQSNENIASGGDFNTGTSTAPVTVSSGQSVTGVNADLTVPQQYTFELMDGTQGSMNFSIPWGQVDPTQASQSIALTDFSLTLGSQTFYESSTTFTTSPSIQFAYGQMQGITFAFDASGSGLPYSTVSMPGSDVLTAYNTNMNMPESTTANAANPTTTLIFTNMHAPGKPNGEIGEGSLLFTIVTQNGTEEFGVQIGPTGSTPDGLASEVQAALANHGFTATIGGPSKTNVTFQGAANNPISSVTITVGGNQNLQETHQGCTVTIK